MFIKETGTIFSLSILFFVFSVYGQEGLDNSLEDYLQCSSKAYQSKNFSEFHRVMTKIVELEPRNYRYRYDLACACALNDDVQHSVQILWFLLAEDCDLAILADTDTDFDRIRQTAEFQEITSRIREKTKPLNNSSVAFTIPEKDLIPEGIAYDPVEQTFYLGSLQKCKIIRIDKQKRVSDFTGPRQDGLVPVLGMKVDAQRRILWAISSYGYPTPSIPAELLGISGVFKYDLKTRKLLKKYMLPQKENRYLNDLALHSNGDVYVTDSKIPAVYWISADKDSIMKFCDLPRSPNGIDFSLDERRLFIAGSGIGVLEISTKNFRELKHSQKLFLSGDGLYTYQNSLIVIQNGGLKKVMRFTLNETQDEIIRSLALEAFHPLFNMPTTGVVIQNDFFFIANSQLRDYDAEGNLFPLSELDETIILRIRLQ